MFERKRGRAFSSDDVILTIFPAARSMFRFIEKCFRELFHLFCNIQFCRQVDVRRVWM